VQFDSAFILDLYQKEKLNPTPHPIAADMGGGFFLMGLWSGQQPCIILPNYIVGIVIDSSENQDQIKKQLRKITNNILLKFRDNLVEIDPYMENIWESIQANKWDSIVLEKAPTIAGTSASVVSPTSLVIESDSSVTSDVSENFDDLLSLQGENNEGDNVASPSLNGSPNPFSDNNSANSFGSQPNGDNFHGGNQNDPFGGGNMSKDPFGGSSISKDPFGGNGISKDPFSEGNLGIQQTSKPNPIKASVDPFAENPFGDPSFSENPFENASSEKEIDPFADNPFATEPSPKKSSKQKEPDPFSDNPFN
jgi:hypothetical protein